MTKHKVLTYLAAGVLLALATPQSRAADIHVPADYTTIQAAIDAAAPGDTVVVRSGFYFGDGFHDINFRGKAITVRSDTGNAGDCQIDCRGKRGFLFMNGEGASSVLSGFAIFNGYSDTTAGGAVRIAGASPTIRNCDLHGYSGGDIDCAVYVASGRPAFEYCDINNSNTALQADYSTTRVTLTGCVFHDNFDSIFGGGNAIIDVTDSAFWWNNTGVVGSDIHVTVKNSVFSENWETGISLGGASTFDCEDSGFGWNGMDAVDLWNSSTGSIRRSSFGWNYNAAVNVGDGTPFVAIDACEIFGNVSGFITNDGGSAQIVNSVIWGNGNAVWTDTRFAQTTLTNCTVVFNGSGVGSGRTSIVATNCILWWNGNGDPWQGNANDLYGTAKATYSCIGNLTTKGSGNLNADPLFVANPTFDYNSWAWTPGDFRLQATSPCVNKGTLFAPLLPASDFFGNARVAGVLPDIGAVELPFAITGITPDHATVGVAGPNGLRLTVSGTAFAPGIQLLWNGLPRVTAASSRTRTAATLLPADLSTVGTFSVQMRLPDGETTPPVDFVVGYPVPVITKLSPSWARVGSPDTPVVVSGQYFRPGSVVRIHWSSYDWYYQDLPASYDPATGNLTVTMPADLLRWGHNNTVSVFTPAPGGGWSKPKVFTVK